MRLTTYSPYDPIELPRELVDILDHFAGVPVSEVLKRIERDAHLTLDSELVQRLVDFEVLRPDRQSDLA